YRAPGTTVWGRVSISDPSGGGMDVRADSNVVPLQYSGRRKRPGMAGATDGQRRVEVPTTRELFCMDRGLHTGPEADEPAVRDELGRTPERFCSAVESTSRRYLRTLSSQLLLDGSPVRMGHRRHLPGGKLFEASHALLVRHGMLSFASPDVMRYFGKRVTQSGDIRADFQGTLEIDFKRRQEGERVKYQMNGNSAKFYDKAYSE